ncbi:P27 family phage terminase small subunit [Dehalobacterium formicoaceticum]|uniref:P27 family phage terminase small subunit n=1 Tax=Dehalobacterium formicoaceticum TaxID=51515 RepID=UPI000B7EA2E5|nr:P27 family phage terminase small subunit [Dehalobacterium formicoaceticum]
MAIAAKETIKRATIRDMKKLGTHKPEFNRLIDIYAELVHQYQRAVADFEESGYQYETETAAGNPKKSGIVSTMENLRKDILAYSDRLCLNPKSLETVTVEVPKKSKLAEALSGLG